MLEHKHLLTFFNPFVTHLPLLFWHVMVTGNYEHFNCWKLFRKALPLTLSSPSKDISTDMFQSLVLVKAKTIANNHIQALNIMNTTLGPQ